MDATAPQPYVLYLRKSKGRAGIGRQRTVTAAHIVRLGGEVAAEFVDTDRTAYRKVGGARPEREGFDRMLAYLREHPGTGVGAWHADRIVRNADDTEELIRVCAAGRHLVETPHGGAYDLGTATGRKRLRNDATDAAFEVDHAIERITAAKLEAASAGLWLGGRRPFGYEKDGVTIRLAEAQALQDGAQGIIDGLSVREVGRRWNAAGIRTTGGRQWSPQEVRRVLRRARNAGLMEHRGKVTGPASWPAAVSEAQWRAVCAILADPGRRTTPGPERRHLLSGLALCGVCETPLIATATTGHGGPSRPVYRCRPASGGGRHVARDVAALDSWVTEVALAVLRRDDVVLPARTPDTGLLRAELAAARGELDELARQVRVIGVRQMAIASAALQEQIGELEGKLAAAQRTSVLGVFGDGQDPAQTWERLTLHQRRAVIGELMSVRVMPSPRGRPAGWKPGRPYFDRDSVILAPTDPA